jgi:anti-sigma regulatory factor (Ser/Thr protein kinase)
MNQGRPKRISSLTLAAVPTAVKVARMFVDCTLKEWNLPALIDMVELLASEVVTNAVKSTGVLNEVPKWTALEGLSLIQIRLVLLEESVIFEVHDRDVTPPVIPEQDLESEGGRGLFLVQSMSLRWNFYRALAARSSGLNWRLPRIRHSACLVVCDLTERVSTGRYGHPLIQSFCGECKRG